MRNIILFILIVLFIITNLSANNIEVLQSKYLLDTNHTYTVEDIYNQKEKLQHFEYSKDTFGFTDATCWIYIKVKNITQKDSVNVVQFLYSLHDYIYVYEYDNYKLIDKYLTGDLTKHNTRKIDLNSIVVPYTIQALKTKEFIFKIDSKTDLSVGLKFLSKDDFFLNSSSIDMFLAGYYGACLIMLIYNLVLYLMIKEKVYLHYILFHLFLLLTLLSSNGYTFTLFWPNTPQINNYFLPLMFILANYYSVAFTQSFLELEKYNIKIVNYFKIILFLDIILFFSTFIFGYSILEIMIMFSFLSILSIISTGLYIFLKFKTDFSKFFLLAWSFLLIGVVLEELQGLGIIYMGRYISYASQFGTILELILLSLALAYKYNIIFSKLTHTETNLKILNKNLEKKEQMLQQQSKLASMGQMIGNIAHQWRQPLAVSNTIVSILKEKSNKNILDKNYTQKKLNEIESTNLYMSQTIEDFLSFFNPSKEKEKFNLKDTIDKAIHIIQNLITRNNINLHINITQNLNIEGYKDQYIQVIISILSNAIYELVDKKDYKEITIIGYKENDITILEIADNAGGISTDIIHRVFEPYFTTKEQSKGTGLGLYISKMIIENSMDGTLEVVNTSIGAKFIIKCK